MRCVQPFAAQQFADLTRTGARISLGKDLRLVLGGERAALGLLDQLWIRDLPRTADPLGRGAPAGPESQLGYANLDLALTTAPRGWPGRGNVGNVRLGKENAGC